MKYNHLIDPSYFDDAIEEFSFDYDWYHIVGMEIDELGNQKHSFEKMTLRGSLQPGSTRRRMDKEGMVETKPYEFYCKSIYRISSGDFIKFNEEWLIVTSVQMYDEYGVRHVSLESADMALYQDLLEAEKALNGEIIV